MASTPARKILGTLVLNESACVKCGSCARECPMGLIKMNPGEHPVMPAQCIKCGHCGAACPVRAIGYDNTTVEEFPPIVPELRCSPQQIEQLVRSRRSIRRFKPTLERAKLDKLLDLIHYAQTGGNTQSVEYLVLLNPEQKHRFAQMVIDWAQEHSSTFPYIKMMIDGWNKGVDVVFRGAPCVIIALCQKPGTDMSAADGAIAMATAELIAPTLGLGTCWAGFLQMAAKTSTALQAEFGDRMLTAAIMVGEPVASYHSCVPRNSPKIDFLL
ncbi:malonic semialdehyde reductase [Pelomyxa schiedti]|nr:malonic semialdehyde reductase [Pelomyxa schiedti]